MTLRGGTPATVLRALERRDPLPGSCGFAGLLEDDGAGDDRLVRDVLGRQPLYVEEHAIGGIQPLDDVVESDVDTTEAIPDTVDLVIDVAQHPANSSPSWSFRPAALDRPVAIPAGTAIGSDGIERVWRLPEYDPTVDHDAALEALAGAVRTAASEVRRSDVAVAFSGGVDSALVAELLDAPLYVVGFPDSHDVAAARTAAATMGRDLTVVELEPADVERAVPTVAREIGRTNAMDVQIALPLYLVATAVAADGFDALAVGQGADELFGGYEKVVRLDHRVEAETVRGAVREGIHTLPAQLPRDVLAIEAAGVTPVAPLLHDAVVAAALRLPDGLLADEHTRKRALRHVAADYLPESIAYREKKAIQYGSLVARELDRLARQAGFKRRMDDHVTKYVQSRTVTERH